MNILDDCIREHFYEINGVDDRPDFYNFRCLLLETLVSAKNLSFTSKSFAVDLFLNFIKLVLLRHIYTYNFYKFLIED